MGVKKVAEVNALDHLLPFLVVRHQHCPARASGSASATRRSSRWTSSKRNVSEQPAIDDPYSQILRAENTLTASVRQGSRCVAVFRSADGAQARWFSRISRSSFTRCAACEVVAFVVELERHLVAAGLPQLSGRSRSCSDHYLNAGRLARGQHGCCGRRRRSLTFRTRRCGAWNRTTDLGIMVGTRTTPKSGTDADFLGFAGFIVLRCFGHVRSISTVFDRQVPPALPPAPGDFSSRMTD